jgi:hypothetical protein
MSGSLYNNYKGFYSVVLMALVDAQYRFVWIDTGGDGCMSDAQIYNQSELGELLESGDIGLPAADKLPRDDRDVPYFLLGDDAFTLRKYMMKPYGTRHLEHSQWIYNYRISRGRRVVENSFGILAQQNQILLTTMMQEPDIVWDIIEAYVCIPNLLRIRNPVFNIELMDRKDEHHNVIPGEWRTGEVLADLGR